MELERWVDERAWIGPDPYEGLNTRLGRMARSRRARQAVIQLYKRAARTPPPPLRAQPAENAKVLGLALAGYATAAGRELDRAGEKTARLVERIASANLAAPDAAWGYPFDAQTRHLFYGRDTPNAIATCFAVSGLLDAHSATGESRAAELALAARPYLLRLGRERPEGAFFAYVAAGSQLIHNANLMVCGTLARLDAVDPAEDSAELARAAASTTIALQRPDGTWPYGEASNLRWADNFHTAYLLEGLHRVSARWGLGADALQRGVASWRERFFGPDGWARYYPDRRYPLETHCCASAIDLLCLLSDAGGAESARDYVRAAHAVADVGIRELWLADHGRFAFRRGRRGLNRREFMRWTNAPMFKALATLCSALERGRPPLAPADAEVG